MASKSKIGGITSSIVRRRTLALVVVVQAEDNVPLLADTSADKKVVILR